MEAGKRDNEDWITGLVSFVCIIGFAIFWLYPVFNKDMSDNYYLNYEKAIFIEAKFLLGSIFHKDVLMLTNENITISSQSFFSTNNTTYPYNMLKEVAFSKYLNRYKLVLKYPSSSWGPDSIALYFNQEDTFSVLYNQFRARSRNRCIISKSF